MLCVVPFVLGWLLIGFAQNLAMLYSGRVISGLACGAISVAAPVSSILSQASAWQWRVKKRLRKSRRGLRKKCMTLNKYIHCSSKLTLDSVHANGYELSAITVRLSRPSHCQVYWEGSGRVLNFSALKLEIRKLVTWPDLTKILFWKKSWLLHYPFW